MSKSKCKKKHKYYKHRKPDDDIVCLASCGDAESMIKMIAFYGKRKAEQVIKDYEYESDVEFNNHFPRIIDFVTHIVESFDTYKRKLGL